MKKIVLGLMVAAGLAASAGAALAHRGAERSTECPSKQDWARCLWLDQKRTG